MNTTLFDTLRAALRGTVERGVPLADCTTWRVGGPADLLLTPADRGDLQRALELLAEAGIPWLALGAGSNLLVRDGGFRGAVIRLRRLRGLHFPGDGRVEAEGGLPLMTLVRAAIERGLGGIETLAGIPGTVGGALAMNAGAGGRQFGDAVRGALLAGPGGSEEWSAARLAFGYRRSAVPGDRIVAAVRLDLQPADRAALAAAAAACLAHRRQAQRVGGPSAGSVFRNPPGRQAWRLIDEAGLRGRAVGGAAISERHCNFIVNRGGATARDILELIELARREVLARTGIELVPEVRIAGEDGRLEAGG